MIELLGFIQYVITLYMYVVIASVILSWLLAFNVINGQNQFVRSLGYAFYAVTEPLLRPIRAFMPDLGGIDISPIILLIGCVGVRDFLIPFLARTLG